MVPQIMQSQKILAVVATIGRPHQGVDVKFGGQAIGEKDTGVVIKLGQNHRTLDAVVKGVVILSPPNPGEIGLIQAILHLLHPRFVGSSRQGFNEGLHQIQEPSLLSGIEVFAGNPFVGNDAVVLHGAAQMQLIGFVTSTFGQISTHAGVIDNGFFALTGTQSLDQRQPLALLVFEHLESRMRALINGIGLRTHESG